MIAHELHHLVLGERVFHVDVVLLKVVLDADALHDEVLREVQVVLGAQQRLQLARLRVRVRVRDVVDDRRDLQATREFSGNSGRH